MGLLDGILGGGSGGGGGLGKMLGGLAGSVVGGPIGGALGSMLGGALDGDKSADEKGLESAGQNLDRGVEPQTRADKIAKALEKLGVSIQDIISGNVDPSKLEDPEIKGLLFQYIAATQPELATSLAGKSGGELAGAIVDKAQKGAVAYQTALQTPPPPALQIGNSANFSGGNGVVFSSANNPAAFGGIPTAPTGALSAFPSLSLTPDTPDVSVTMGQDGSMKVAGDIKGIKTGSEGLSLLL